VRTVSFVAQGEFANLLSVRKEKRRMRLTQSDIFGRLSPSSFNLFLTGSSYPLKLGLIFASQSTPSTPSTLATTPSPLSTPSFFCSSCTGGLVGGRSSTTSTSPAPTASKNSSSSSLSSSLSSISTTVRLLAGLPSTDGRGMSPPGPGSFCSGDLCTATPPKSAALSF
jgi:hypothetical protein